MNAVLNIGKYLFAVPFAVFGIIHLMNADAMAGMAPFGGSIIIYITGLALIAATVSIIIGKMDKLATVLLGVFMLSTALLVHAAGVANAADEMAASISMSGLLKDLSLAGAAWMYAKTMARDNAVVG
jgi:putative oxidoreductase